MDQKEQMQFFYDIFDASLPRLGPGDDASTRKALRTLLATIPQSDGSSRRDKLRILDLGCGNGAQTIQLAKHTDSTILAIDNHQPYLDELRRRAEAEGLSEKIQIILADMANTGLIDEFFDLIWSEGALYIMGFSNGLKAYHSVLSPDGFFAVTELSWLRYDAPDECQQYFDNEYPAMATVDINLAIIKSCGYEVIRHFTLPESSWWEPYYHPLEDRLQSMHEKYAADPLKLEVVESIQKEIDIYRKYCSYYDYVFYLMKRCV